MHQPITSTKDMKDAVSKLTLKNEMEDVVVNFLDEIVKNLTRAFANNLEQVGVVCKCYQIHQEKNKISETF